MVVLKPFWYVQDKKTVLSEYQTLGEESIREFCNIIHDFTSDINLEKVILDKIKHPLHHVRILEDIYKIWPHDFSKYKIRLKTPEGTQIELKPNFRLLIHSLISEEFREKVSTKGVLSMFQVAPTKQKIIRIIGLDVKINCNFPKELEKNAKKLVGKPAIIYGHAVFDANGNIKEITEVDKIKQFTDLKLSSIFSGTEELQFSQPLIVSIDYKEDMWIMENRELGAVAINTMYDECLDSFHKEILFIWKEYNRSSDNELSLDAINLKNKILEYLEPEVK